MVTKMIKVYSKRKLLFIIFIFILIWPMSGIVEVDFIFMQKEVWSIIFFPWATHNEFLFIFIPIYNKNKSEEYTPKNMSRW